MKRTFTLLLMLTITTFIVTLGCDTGSSGDADDDSNNTIQFTEGWWRYQTDIAGTQVTYILYNSDKTVLRAGTNLHEYPSDYLEGHLRALSFDLIASTVSTTSTFTPVHDNSLPDWANNNDEPIQFVAGWWLFAGHLNSENLPPLYTYILYDSDQTVLRVGSESCEYYPNFVEMNVYNYIFDNCVSRISVGSEFTHVADNLLPDWTDKEDGTLQFTEGWWRYQIYDSDCSLESYYILYDSNQTVLRVGSESQELDNTDDSFYNWYFIANSVCTRQIFSPASEDSLPDWAIDESNNNDTSGIWWVFEDGWYVNG